MTNSEARKRHAEQDPVARAPFLVAEQQRRREIVQQAMSAVYYGAGFLEADTFLEHLDDLGATVQVRP